MLGFTLLEIHKPIRLILIELGRILSIPSASATPPPPADLKDSSLCRLHGSLTALALFRFLRVLILKPFVPTYHNLCSVTIQAWSILEGHRYVVVACFHLDLLLSHCKFPVVKGFPIRPVVQSQTIDSPLQLNSQLPSNI